MWPGNQAFILPHLSAMACWPPQEGSVALSRWLSAEISPPDKSFVLCPGIPMSTIESWRKRAQSLARRGVTCHWHLVPDIQVQVHPWWGAFGLPFIAILCPDKASESSCLWFPHRPGTVLWIILLGSLALPGAPLEWDSFQDDSWLSNIFRVHVLFLGKIYLPDSW